MADRTPNRRELTGTKLDSLPQPPSPWIEFDAFRAGLTAPQLIRAIFELATNDFTGPATLLDGRLIVQDGEPMTAAWCARLLAAYGTGRWPVVTPE